MTGTQLRGMLPHKTVRGQLALGRLAVSFSAEMRSEIPLILRRQQYTNLFYRKQLDL
jgi:hypothetical protein